MSTLRDRKLAMKPSFSSRARMSTTATSSAHSPAMAIHSVEPPATPSAVRPAAIVIAVAESAPTTRWREEPRMANRKTGMRMV